MKQRLERGMDMKKNKGFTLIELLAVIVILAIIALIAVPTVMNIINKANKSAFKDSAYGLIKAGELFYTDQLLTNAGLYEDKTFTFPNDIDGLEIKGSKPTEGYITINKDGKIEMAVTNGKYCVIKDFDDDDIKISDGNCELSKEETNVVYYNPVTDKLCSNYVEINSETGVKEGCLRWYVHKVEDNKITLMLDHNTTANIEPISNDDKEIADEIYKQTGKIVYVTSNNQMKEDTKNWKAEASSIMFEDIVYSTPWFVNQEDKSDLSSLYEEYYTLILGLAEQIQTQLNTEDYETIDAYIDAVIVLGNEKGLLPKEYMYRDLLKNYLLTGNELGYLIEPFMAEMFDTSWGFLNFMLYGTSFDNDKFGLRPVITLDNNYKAISQAQVTDLIIEEEKINIMGTEMSNITTYIGPRYIKNDHTKLKYTSNDTSIATVDKNGKITGISGGTTTITVSTTDGSNISKTINVTIESTYKNGIMASTSNCINNGICESGELVIVKVNNNQSYRFYVVEDKENKLTLIMNRNLGESVAWYKDNDESTTNEENNLGPITVLNYLNSQTADWTNIPAIEGYTYINNLNGTTSNYGYQKLEIKNGVGKLTSQDGKTDTEVIGVSKARLLTYEESATIKTNNSNVTPNWLYGNLSDYNTTENAHGYWLLTAHQWSSNSGCNVEYDGLALIGSVYVLGFGARPVITLSK